MRSAAAASAAGARRQSEHTVTANLCACPPRLHTCPLGISVLPWHTRRSRDLLGCCVFCLEGDSLRHRFGAARPAHKHRINTGVSGAGSLLAATAPAASITPKWPLPRRLQPFGAFSPLFWTPEEIALSEGLPFQI
jgi:hypothetical protein